MTKSKKLLATALTCLTVAATAAGCGKNKGILIWVGAESVQYYETKLQEYTANYKAANGKEFPYKFDVKGVDTGAAAATFLQDTEAGADIFTIPHDNLAKLTDGTPAIMPITDESLLSQIEQDNSDSFKSVIKSTFNDKTYTFAVPYISQALVLYYNKQYVSAEQAKTWEGLREAAVAASTTLGKTVQAGSLLGTDGFNFSFPILARTVDGGETTVKIYEDGIQSNCNITGDDTVSIMKWCQEYFADPNGMKFPSSSGWEVELNTKTSLSVVGGAWNLNAAKAALGEENVAITTLPTFRISATAAYGSVEADTEYQSGTFADCKVFVMKRTSKYKEYLQDVVKFLSSKEVQEGSFGECANVPSYVNAASEFAAMNEDTLVAKLAKAQIEMSKHGISQPFGIKSKYNVYYYQNGAPDIIKAIVDNKDGDYSTHEQIKAELGVVQSIWTTGKKPQ